jgi:hypothetical protein
MSPHDVETLRASCDGPSFCEMFCAITCPVAECVRVAGWLVGGRPTVPQRSEGWRRVVGLRGLRRRAPRRRTSSGAEAAQGMDRGRRQDRLCGAAGPSNAAKRDVM